MHRYCIPFMSLLKVTSTKPSMKALFKIVPQSSIRISHFSLVFLCGSYYILKYYGITSYIYMLFADLSTCSFPFSRMKFYEGKDLCLIC